MTDTIPDGLRLMTTRDAWLARDAGTWTHFWRIEPISSDSMSSYKSAVEYTIGQVANIFGQPHLFLEQQPRAASYGLGLMHERARLTRLVRDFANTAEIAAFMNARFMLCPPPSPPWVLVAEDLLRRTWAALHASGFFLLDDCPDLMLERARNGSKGPAGRVFGTARGCTRDNPMFVMVRVYQDVFWWSGFVDAMVTLLHEAGHVRQIALAKHLKPGGAHNASWRAEYRRAVRTVFPASARNKFAHRDMSAATKARALDKVVFDVVGCAMISGIEGLAENEVRDTMKVHWFKEVLDLSWRHT